MASENNLGRTRCAILIEQGFDDLELKVPYEALKQAGADVVALGSRIDAAYTGKRGGTAIRPEGTTTEVGAAEFHAVIIAGGLAPDIMRTNMKTVRFVQDALHLGKLVGAIGHGVQLLIEADALHGRRVTCGRSIRKDVQNAGGHYENVPCVQDANLVTARAPGDLPIFAAALLKQLNLGIGIQGIELPDPANPSAEWWKLGEAWGGSTQKQLIDGLNEVIRGERYALEAFARYTDKTHDDELRTAFREIMATKQKHLGLLESRIQALGESPRGGGLGAIAGLKKLFLPSDPVEILRRALGELQTGVVDAYALLSSFTDPATAVILHEMEVDLARHERRVGDLYRLRVGGHAQPAVPSSGAALVR